MQTVLVHNTHWLIYSHEKQKKKEKLRKKIKVNFHPIIVEDKKGDKICSSNVDITSPGFLLIFDLDL